MIKLKINGKPVNIDVDGSTPLLWLLREQLGLTGTKYGCGIGLCGSCTVHIDGEAVRSCIGSGVFTQCLTGHYHHRRAFCR